MRIEEELKLDYSDVFLFRPKRSTLKVERCKFYELIDSNIVKMNGLEFPSWLQIWMVLEN